MLCVFLGFDVIFLFLLSVLHSDAVSMRCVPQIQFFFV